MIKLISVFRKGNYTRLFFASFMSQMGGTIGLTALMFYLLDRFSEQPMYATITELMLSLPTLAVFFLVGVFADRFDRKKIALYSDWICSASSFLVLVCIITDLIPLMFAMLFMRSAVKSFFVPAQTSLIQGILSNEEYSSAAGLNQMVASMFMLFGNAIGIFFYWAIGIEGALLVDVASFIISALLVKSCEIPKEIRMPNGENSIKDLKVQLVLKDFKVGIKYILNHKLLLTLITGFIVFGIVNGGLSVMQVFILKYKLATENYEEVSMILGVVFGLGFMVGSISAAILASKLKHHQLLIIALIIGGSAILIGSLVNTVWAYLICSCLIGLSLPGINVSIGGWLPKIVAPKMMGRVQGLLNPLVMLSQSATLGFIIVFYPTLISIEFLYWLVGGSLIAVSLFYSIVLPKFAENKQVANMTNE